MTRFGPPTPEQMAKLKAIYTRHPADPEAVVDPRVEKLVIELIGCIADKWTMLILETLSGQGTQRFGALGRTIGGVSQKMLTQTLREMERNGLVSRKMYPEVPPHVEYSITELGLTLSAAFCGVWVWAADKLIAVEAARDHFDREAAVSNPVK